MMFLLRRLHTSWCPAILLSIALLAGCSGGPTTAEVSGTIKLNGKAPNLEGLQVSFMGKDGRPVSAEVAKDGSFTATGVQLGESQVGLSYVPPEAIATIDKVGKSRPESPDQLPKGPDGKPNPKAFKPEGKDPFASKFKNPIPDHLRDPRTSKKTITVEAGKDNILNWDVRK